MKIPHALLFSFSLIIFSITYLSSCSPVPYGNVGQNVPMLKNKGEVSLTGSYASTDDATGVGFQAAVAADSSLALMTSFYSLNNNPTTDWNGSGRYFELGAGRYGGIGNSNFVYDIFAGVGFGGIKNDNGVGSSLNINIAKPFVQGSIGLLTKWVEVAFTSRFALPVYTNYENNLSDPDERAQAETYFKDNKSQFVFEPGFTFRFGFKAVKANFSFCTSSFRLDDDYSDVSINSNYLSAGVAVLVSKRYEKKN
jgi:hypothetical protein